MQHIKYGQAMEWLFSNIGQRAVKVISGMRGCGKTTLLQMFRAALEEKGNGPVLSYDLDCEDALPLLAEGALEAAVRTAVQPGIHPVVLLDEVPAQPQFLAVLDRLAFDMGCDVYAAFSGAWNAPEQITALFSGRHVKFDMMPLSFAEYRSCLSGGRKSSSVQAGKAAFGTYLQHGSFPCMVPHAGDAEASRRLMRLLFSSAMYHDVLMRSGLTDAAILMEVARGMTASLGSPISPASISRELSLRGKKIDPKTADRYLWALAGSLIMQPVQRMNLRSGEVLSTRCRYYASEPAMLPLCSGGVQVPEKAVLENVVYENIALSGISVNGDPVTKDTAVLHADTVRNLTFDGETLC